MKKSELPPLRKNWLKCDYCQNKAGITDAGARYCWTHVPDDLGEN